jgi:hypothetical protein
MNFFYIEEEASNFLYELHDFSKEGIIHILDILLYLVGFSSSTQTWFCL